MRDIKFRAWHQLRKEMWDCDDLILGRCYLAPSGVGFVRLTGDGCTEQMKALIPLQYTGLKGKNGKGKEIYEADIFNNTNKTAVGIVSWYKDQWVIKFPNYQYSLFQFLENDETREKIGNIYENQDLLK